MKTVNVREFKAGDMVRDRYAFDAAPMRVLDVTSEPVTAYTHRDGSVTRWFGYLVDAFGQRTWLSGADLVRA